MSEIAIKAEVGIKTEHVEGSPPSANEQLPGPPSSLSKRWHVDETVKEEEEDASTPAVSVKVQSETRRILRRR
jgi:hypothetical protein